MSKILLYQLKFHLQLISATRQLTFTSNLVKGQTKILLRVWSTRSNSLSCFLAHEKEVHWTSTRPYISKLVKKRPVWVLIRSLVFKLMKKRPVRVFFLIFVYERHQSHYASAFDSCCYFTLVLR